MKVIKISIPIRVADSDIVCFVKIRASLGTWVPPMFELSGKLDQICSVIVKRDECRWVPKQLLKHVDSQIFASSLSISLEFEPECKEQG
jgi:hypothetical protein